MEICAIAKVDTSDAGPTARTCANAGESEILQCAPISRAQELRCRHGRTYAALVEMVEKSPLNKWEKGSGKVGVITYGIGDMYVREVKETLGADIDILSLAFTIHCRGN